MTVRELTLGPPVSIAPLATTDEAIALMWRHDVRHLLVADRQGLAGVVSDGDLLESVGMLMRAERECLVAGACEEILVADVMDAEASCVTPDTPLTDAAHHMIYGVRTALPVMIGTRLAGIVTEPDLLGLFAGPDAPGWAAMHEEQVIDHCSRMLQTVSRDDCVRKVCERLNGGKHRSVLVVENGRLVGMVSDWDVRLAIGRSPVGEWLNLPLAEIMVAHPRTLRPDDTLDAAARLMRDHSMVAVPVTTPDGLLLGVITVTDLLRVFVADAVIHA
jgi:CBS domain-containing protein